MTGAVFTRRIPRHSSFPSLMLLSGQRASQGTSARRRSTWTRLGLTSRNNCKAFSSDPGIWATSTPKSFLGLRTHIEFRMGMPVLLSSLLPARFCFRSGGRGLTAGSVRGSNFSCIFSISKSQLRSAVDRSDRIQVIVEG